MNADDFERLYTPVIALAAEGARIGLTVCRQCGAALLLAEHDMVDRPQFHSDWHGQGNRLPPA